MDVVPGPARPPNELQVAAQLLLCNVDILETDPAPLRICLAPEIDDVLRVAIQAEVFSDILRRPSIELLLRKALHA